MAERRTPELWGTPGLVEPESIRRAAALVAERIGRDAAEIERDLTLTRDSDREVCAKLVAQVFGVDGPTVAPPPYANRARDEYAHDLRRLLDERERLGAVLRRNAEIGDSDELRWVQIAALEIVGRSMEPADALRGTDEARFAAIDAALDRFRSTHDHEALDRLCVGHESIDALERRVALVVHEALRDALAGLREALLRGEPRPFLADGWPSDADAAAAKRAVIACARLAAIRGVEATLFEHTKRDRKRLSDVIDSPAFRARLRAAKGSLQTLATSVLNDAGLVPKDTFAKWKRAEGRTDTKRAARARGIKARRGATAPARGGNR